MKPFRLCSFVAAAVVATLILSVGVGTASAQGLSGPWQGVGAKTPIETTYGVSDLLKVNYFSNANTTNAPDGTVQITNPGSPVSAAGNLCAQIYVYDPDQELSECCACLVTPDGLRTLSVDTDLTANPLNSSSTLTTGSVSIVSGILPAKGCSPLNNLVSPTIRAWGTHIQNVTSSTFSITETEYSDRALGNYNYNLLIDCYAISLVGSGNGVCSCGAGDNTAHVVINPPGSFGSID
jgi:hypothetical protein